MRPCDEKGRGRTCQDCVEEPVMGGRSQSDGVERDMREHGLTEEDVLNVSY